MKDDKDDEVIAEIRKFRDQHARKFDYDLKAIVEDYQRIARESGRRQVTRAPKRLRDLRRTA